MTTPNYHKQAGAVLAGIRSVASAASDVQAGDQADKLEGKATALQDAIFATGDKGLVPLYDLAGDLAAMARRAKLHVRDTRRLHAACERLETRLAA